MLPYADLFGDSLEGSAKRLTRSTVDSPGNAATRRDPAEDAASLGPL